MVPAALMGLDLDALLAGARDDGEPRAGSTSARDNPGLALGAFMAAGASVRTRQADAAASRSGCESFGLWVEQLVAESTGKQGKGVVPIAGESLDMSLGADRVVVVGARWRRDTGRRRHRQREGRPARRWSTIRAAGRARARRGVPALGDRDGDRRPADGDQSVRRAERASRRRTRRGAARGLSAEHAAAAARAARGDRRRPLDAERGRAGSARRCAGRRRSSA